MKKTVVPIGPTPPPLGGGVFVCGITGLTIAKMAGAALQGLANKTGLVIYVCHFPPGTGKWNKIEHKMFSYITQNRRGRPLISHEVVINLIANTKTKSGLRIRAGLDNGHYETEKKVRDEELEKIKLKQARFHGDWNYSISPNL